MSGARRGVFDQLPQNFDYNLPTGSRPFQLPSATVSSTMADVHVRPAKTPLLNGDRQF
jgi:hypothetical protein